MKALNSEKLKIYIIEVIRIAIILIVIYILNSFVSSLPFVSSLNIFNEKIYLYEFISFIMMLLACFMIYEFSLRTRNIVDEMVVLIPGFGNIHSYSIYLIVIIIAYFSAYSIFLKFFGEDWLWSYNLIFLAFSLFYVAKIFIIFYKKSHTVSSNIVELMGYKDKKL